MATMQLLTDVYSCWMTLGKSGIGEGVVLWISDFYGEEKMDMTGTFRKESRGIEGSGLGWIIDLHQQINNMAG